jgi:hypothetical protein
MSTNTREIFCPDCGQWYNADCGHHCSSPGAGYGIHLTKIAKSEIKISEKEEYCNCDDYKENLEKINNKILFCYTHGILYDGKQFVYCPWCGKRLKEDNEKDNI